MPLTSTPATGSNPTRHAHRRLTHPLARVLAFGTTALLVLGAATAAALYVRLEHNIDSVDVSGLLGSDRPAVAATPADPADPNAGRAMNILLLASDQRDGANAALGGEVDGMRSDTAIVLHLSADRTRADAVSIPRDLLVDIPACERSDGTMSRAHHDQFNDAFATGAGPTRSAANGAACAMKTVEQTAGIRFDTSDYLVVTFEGFVRTVDALGGIDVCIPNDISSPEANHLTLTAGLQTLDGSTALGYARARKGTGLGDGSDTARIVRQQQLLAATVRTVQSKSLLTDAPALLRFVDAATSSVAASPGLASIPALVGLAVSLRDTAAGNVTFMTVPSAPAPSDRNRVVATGAAAAVWASVAADRPIAPASTPASPASPATDPTTATDPTPAVGATRAPATPAAKAPLRASDLPAACG